MFQFILFQLLDKSYRCSNFWIPLFPYYALTYSFFKHAQKMIFIEDFKYITDSQKFQNKSQELYFCL